MNVYKSLYKSDFCRVGVVLCVTSEGLILKIYECIGGRGVGGEDVRVVGDGGMAS